MVDPTPQNTTNQPYWQPPSQSAGVTDVVTQLQGIVRQLTNLVLAINGRNVYGHFTMPAANTLTVPNTAVKSNSIITITPTDASAATLQGAATALYVTISAGTSFTVSTANGGSAAGTETFNYAIETPT